MGLSKIEINFRKAEEEAKRLEELADEIKDVANQKMTETFQQMSACWKGDTASIYFSKAEKIRQEILETSKKLYAAAEDIRSQAKRIYEAEKKAIAFIQSPNNN